MDKFVIGVCCTFGAGSSMLLKMNLEQALSQMGVAADVEIHDISSISGVAGVLDAVYTSSALISEVQAVCEGTKTIVIPVIDYFDLNKLQELTKEYLLKE